MSWDLIILHPPCQHMCVSGNRWYANSAERTEATNWTMTLWESAISKADFVCLENPPGFSIPGADKQTIQPHQFGHPETKMTNLWLHNLPPLEPTTPWMVEAIEYIPAKLKNRVHYTSPGPNRSRNRSETYRLIADQMAEQWGDL